MDDLHAAAHAAITARDWSALRPIVHPYLHWVCADGQVLRGRTKVIAVLQASGIPDAPASVEFRDAQIYRWHASPVL